MKLRWHAEIVQKNSENAGATLKNCFKLVAENNLSERNYSLRQMHFEVNNKDTKTALVSNA